jgi:IS30 family transposase
MPGRPRALNEVKRRKVCDLVSAGCSVEAAAYKVGCNAITIRRESLRNPEFCEQLRQAKLTAQSTPLHKPRKAARARTRPATNLQTTLPNESARPEPILIGTDEAKILVETIVKSKFNQPNDAETVDRMLRKFDAVMAQFERHDHAGKAPPTEAHAQKQIATCDPLNKSAQKRTKRARFVGPRAQATLEIPTNQARATDKTRE